MNTISAMIVTTTAITGQPEKPRARLPMNCATPFASVAAASASPPPNRISTPHGSLTAVPSR